MRFGLGAFDAFRDVPPEQRARFLDAIAQSLLDLGDVLLAFSVAGGDTASAVAAGCSVVAKAHPAHPGTSELVGRAIQATVQRCGLPEGVFSLSFGAGNELGLALVGDPRIAAVGFTGSRGGGLALMHAAAQRPVPIPVYAEMSSINPMFLLRHAPGSRAAEIGRGLAASLTMGAWQFCTLAHEVFGAASLIVRCPDAAAMRDLAEGLEGQLTATLMMEPADLEQARALLPVLERRVGRIVVNGFPTGVEVSHSMVHGGPFPSTSDGRTTSVGTLATRRFLRPICYRDFPSDLLPEALRDPNTGRSHRLRDGVFGIH